MTTWLKKLRLYLLRRQLKSTTRRLIQLALNDKQRYSGYSFVSLYVMQQRNDLMDRIAEIEKTL